MLTRATAGVEHGAMDAGGEGDQVGLGTAGVTGGWPA